MVDAITGLAITAMDSTGMATVVSNLFLNMP
jgi:hypothetical protein